MTIRRLKKGITEAARAQEDAKVRAVVESTLADIEANGDKAVASLSEKFDKFSRPVVSPEPKRDRGGHVARFNP